MTTWKEKTLKINNRTSAYFRKSLSRMMTALWTGQGIKQSVLGNVQRLEAGATSDISVTYNAHNLQSINPPRHHSENLLSSRSSALYACRLIHSAQGSYGADQLRQNENSWYGKDRQWNHDSFDVSSC
jgi:hypothetical protein